MKSMEPFYKVAAEMPDPFGSPSEVQKALQPYKGTFTDQIRDLAAQLWDRANPVTRLTSRELMRKPYWAAEQRRRYGAVVPGRHSLAAAAFRAGGGRTPFYRIREEGIPVHREISRRPPESTSRPPMIRPPLYALPADAFLAGLEEHKERLSRATERLSEAELKQLEQLK